MRRDAARNSTRKSPAVLTVLASAALGGCASMHGLSLAPGEAKVLVGPAVRENRTPMDPVLSCVAGQLPGLPTKPLVIAVGDVRDYTGKYSVSEGNAVTQGGALMVASALGKLEGRVRIAERFDPTIAERELGYTDRRQLGDGTVHDLPGPSGKQTVPWLPYYGGSIAASDYYIVGGITELNYDIRSGGLQTGVGSIGPKHRTYTQSVAVDLRIVDTRSLLVVRTVSLTKQFTGYETGFGIFRFFGSDLFDINIGAKGQEPLQLGIRAALEEATVRLLGAVARIDVGPCLANAGWGETGAAALSDLGPLVALRSPAIGDPFNGLPSAAAPLGADVQIVFEVGSDTLSGAASALVERIAADAARGPVSVTLLARDTETIEPAKRTALTDRRLAALSAALARRGIDPASISIIWRPAPADTSLPSAGAGLLRLAQLRIS
ncbi:CsgG/HfaB family protein [Novosphingobium pokkalii]|uniref:CsgG/HfaB family protein n=1 Tax=Novosphingobium pokkalii TaxID=1770194 RepID=A0ABV7UY70_9SPHN|nr:CsgG/HfaB family protein [Novosphingobium pokkalii]GHC96844.1 hypothetical protein GCM10019060_27090 [Novosphingobium pokkalii]